MHLLTRLLTIAILALSAASAVLAQGVCSDLSFTRPNSIWAGAAHGIAVADFNKDGRPDLAVTDRVYDRVFILWFRCKD
jgi:C4-dicarboxylate transporter